MCWCRFQFDMTLGRKKKLNNNIQFPEVTASWLVEW